MDFVPDKEMLKIQYYIKLGRKLNLSNPKRFTEKLQSYKLYYRNEILHQCVDKYNVRDYVNSKGLAHILNDLYGVYNQVNGINGIYNRKHSFMNELQLLQMKTL